MYQNEPTQSDEVSRVVSSEPLRLKKWSMKPIRLFIKNIGPFRGEDPYVLEFNGRRMTSDPTSTMRPRADMFMIMGENGCGKTTVFECIAGLFDRLNDEPGNDFGNRLEHGAYAMMDLLVRHKDGNQRDRRQGMMLRLWISSEMLEPHAYKLPPSQYDHHPTACLGFMARDASKLAQGTCKFGSKFLDRLRSDIGTGYSEISRGSLEIPALLHFRPSWHSEGIERSYGIRREFIRHRPLHEFSGTGESRGTSLYDYMRWISDKDPVEYVEMIKYLNNKVFFQFKSPKRLFGIHIKAFWDQEWATVDPEGDLFPDLNADRPLTREHLKLRSQRSHGVSKLSSGESMLLQLYAWLRICSRRSMIILIDEIDMHIGRDRADKLLLDLEEIAKQLQNTTVMFTTHDRMLIDTFLKGSTSERRRGGVHISMEDAA